VVTIATHNRSTTRYAYLPPPGGKTHGNPVTLALFAGGSGHVALDDHGCPHALQGNSLIRSIALFGSAGFGTAVVDAPSDYHGEDGLGGFRTATKHAEDIGNIIADLRTRTKGAVWLVGTSRGTISAANAAARLSGPLAPDGIVLTSALMAGDSSANKDWVAQTVFDLPLEAVGVPVLIVGHTADRCVRSPAKRMAEITARTNSTREQVVTVTGGPGSSGGPSLAACQGRKPHGFIDQEAEVASGMARFIRGGAY
jgi:pimeloyl-ACP methyl ester carboxylesterase